MSYAKKIVGADEKLIGVCNLHWIYLVRGGLYMAFFAYAGWLVRWKLPLLLQGYEQYSAVLSLFVLMDVFSWVLLLTGVTIFLLYAMKMLFTEIALTDKRVIIKKGMIFVDIKEEDLEEIKGASVANGLLGRFLNYGYVFLDARFIKNIYLPAIPSPYSFIKAVNKAKGDLKPDTLKMVLDEKGISKVLVASQRDVDTRPSGPRKFSYFNRLRRSLKKHFAMARA